VVALTFTVKSASTLEPIEGARILAEADSGGDLPSNDSISITRSGSTASVTHTAHGMSNGDTVIIRGASQDEYNGRHVISNVTTNAYDYTVSGSPSTPATGSPTATAQIFIGQTDANGVATYADFSYTTNQPITGKIRKADSTPLYKSTAIIGTITSSGFENTFLMVGDE
jgi:hypothetical protein